MALNKINYNGKTLVSRAMAWYTVVRETENTYVLESVNGGEFCVGIVNVGSMSARRDDFVQAAQAAANMATDDEFDNAVRDMFS